MADFKLSIEECEDLIYNELMLEMKECYIPAFQDKVIEVIKKIRGDD